MAVLAAGALVVAAFPTYWSYKCRYEGRLCENSSFSAPSAETLVRNQKLLQKSMADSAVPSGEFRLVPRETFWSGARLDLVFSPPDKEDIVTDSLEIGDVEFLETFRFQSSRAFGATYSKRENVSGRWQLSSHIVIFFEADGLAKRVFSIGCAGRYLGYSDPSIEVRNLAYDVKASTLLFALISSCSRPEINDKFTIPLDLPYPNNDEAVSVISRGETVSIRLDDQLQAVAVETSKEREKKEKEKADSEKSKLKLASCNEREIGRWASGLAQGGELLVACTAVEDNSYPSYTSKYQINRITKNESKTLIEDSCTGFARVVSQRGVQPPYVAIVCSSWSGMYRALTETASTTKDDKSEVNKADWQAEWIEIVAGPAANEYSMQVRCECENLTVDKLSFEADSRSAVFEIETDASEVVVEGRGYSLSKREPHGALKATVALYKVQFDNIGRAMSFEPVAAAR
jgi:hypothetical protein